MIKVALIRAKVELPWGESALYTRHNRWVRWRLCYELFLPKFDQSLRPKKRHEVGS